jgi:hypothetical protein
MDYLHIRVLNTARFIHKNLHREDFPLQMLARNICNPEMIEHLLLYDYDDGDIVIIIKNVTIEK